MSPPGGAGAQPEHLDVVVVGAGLAGIAAGYHLQSRCPGMRYAILESRETLGGTWDLFRYPGVRSDSDMYTLGYPFRPWPGPRAIADGASILAYLRETAARFGIEEQIRYGHRVLRAEYGSDTARWTLEVQHAGAAEPIHLTCAFLLMCTGYYRYDEGYTPNFTGRERFGGEVVHPQHWREDVQYEGRRVVVIGSGASAVTLVPALAARAAHVTMLQRSPSYIVSLAAGDSAGSPLDRLAPAAAAYRLRRWQSILLTQASYELSRRRPELAKTLLRRAVARQLPPDVSVEEHFTPAYNPWDQRLCVALGGDLFKAIRAGRASVLTGRVSGFTERGVALASGAELEADLVVTATGLRLLAFGGVELVVDGEPIDLPKTMGYRGTMLSGVPNFAFVLGYTNASWTLKCDLVCAYVCRLLAHMDARGYRQVVPRRDPSVPERPFVELTSSYVRRSGRGFPKQGDRPPWRLHQSYPRDLLSLRMAPLQDGVLAFSRYASSRA